MEARVIHNSDEAMQLLTHRRTGKNLLRREIAPQTSLVYGGESMVALTFWNRPIAWYMGDETVLTVPANLRVKVQRSQRTTWRRIRDFTVAEPFTENGLRLIADSTEIPSLYQPKLRIGADGTVTNFMRLGRQEKIRYAAQWWARKIPWFSKQALEQWDDLSFQQAECDFCHEREITASEPNYHFETCAHIAEHIDRTVNTLGEMNEAVFPRLFRDVLDREGRGYVPPEIARKNTLKAFTRWLFRDIFPYVVERADPDRTYVFPHPKSSLHYYYNAS